MSNPPVHPPARPPDPAPLAPRHGAVVDGASFTLEWERIPGAVTYCVQIAPSPTFEAVVFERHLPADSTSLVLHYAHPGDGHAFYWRVRARDDESWSAGERIESLITGTASDRDLFAEPDTDEPWGPAARLFSATAEMTRHRRQPGSDGMGRLERAEVFSLDLVLFLAGSLVFALVVVVILTLFAC